MKLGRATPVAYVFCIAVLAPALAFPIWRILTWVSSYASTDLDLADVATALGNTLVLAGLAAVATVLLAFGALAQFFRSGGQYLCKSNFRPMSQKFRYIYF